MTIDDFSLPLFNASEYPMEGSIEDSLPVDACAAEPAPVEYTIVPASSSCHVNKPTESWFLLWCKEQKQQMHPVEMFYPQPATILPCQSSASGECLHTRTRTPPSSSSTCNCQQSSSEEKDQQFHTH